MIKRAIDILVSISLLTLLSPLLAIVAVAIHISMGRPILFRQSRPGRHGQIFQLIKFRTMDDRRDQSGKLLPPGQRITRLGRLLRATSVDELPQLWNVLKGEMSLVGPRPLLPEYMKLYDSHQARRHEVRPGITGWAQVNGRNAIDWEEKLNLDVWYVDNQNLWLDLKILAMTAWKVLRRTGISHSDTEPMPRFTGTRTKNNPPSRSS